MIFVRNQNFYKLLTVRVKVHFVFYNSLVKMSAKKLIKYLVSTWPQRFALAFLTGFLVWFVSGQDLVIFASSVMASMIVYHLLYLRIRTTKVKVNEEIRL